VCCGAGTESYWCLNVRNQRDMVGSTGSIARVVLGRLV